MSNTETINSIKIEIAQICKRIVEKQYETTDEKHKLQKRKWLLKRELSAIETETDCSYLDLFKYKK